MSRRISEQTAHEISTLWDCEAMLLLRYAMVLTGGAQPAAEDLVQRVFMAAAQQWESLATASAFTTARKIEAGRYRAWLRRVCRNLWIDDIRRSQRLKQLGAELARDYLSPPPDPADVILARDALERCWTAIRGFPERRRQVALLYFAEQRSTAQISELLGIEPSGVRKHIALARAALRNAVSTPRPITEPATPRREGQL
ncbi:sigma-70 family RNA polymerase sigma factor [Streptomyces sp. NBC_00988]|uniref:RNA polymerase sigma factor n=1 Tax=Streptomyces sp. NBC_00988 TaxID=2903704 RepID=UPI0038688F92|nr:sigma-70 family RNA polymerase sigma factor [Streptomyces sp. NBC_00988]WSX17736.1 sigma-70 family RNA polymerase sigma factor [Streptomyces sp. NBC_00988]